MGKCIYKIFSFLGASLFLYLTYYSFRYSYINADFLVENLHEIKDNMLLNLIWMIVVLSAGLLIIKVSEKIKEKHFWWILFLVNVFALLLGRYWLLNSHSAPYNDQFLIYQSAEEFASGNYLSLTPYGGYVGKCPHQLGIITFIRILSNIMGSFDYRHFQVFNLYMLPVIITSGYFIVKELTNAKKGARIIYLLVMLLCFPLYVYVPYVYGEMSSIALMFASVWALLSGFRKFKWYKPILVGAFLAIAIQLRRHTLICLIAVLLVVVIYTVLHRKWQYVTYLVAAVVLPLFVEFGVGALYKPYEVQEEYGAPASLYIAMGLNDISEMGAGWYDDSNIRIYIHEAHADVDVAKQIAKEHIKERMTYMLEHKNYAVDFFKRKSLSQWNDPLYLSLRMSGGGVENSEGIVRDIYFGESGDIVLNYSNMYQLVVYFLVFVVFVIEFMQKQGKNDIAFYILLIAVFGGFLFSLIWEAKSRYIFPYFMFMIPYAAIGLDKVYGVIKRH